MANSRRFKELSKRLKELRTHLLPLKFSKTGDYLDRQIDRTRGYRLLVHAEFEAFLEESCRDLILKKISEWQRSNKPSNLIIAFLACYHSGWGVDISLEEQEIINAAKGRTKVKDAAKEAINIAQTQYIQKIKENNGIKEKNFKTMVLPTGVEIDELDQTWLTNLDQFGKLRGDVAHQSKKTQGMINPEDELKLVNTLLKGLKRVDELFEDIASGKRA
jgi:hypothetical protein